MIVIGGSQGGMRALRTILATLPKTFPEAIAVTLHRHRESDDALVHLLQLGTPLSVSEALDKEPIVPGRIYVAPPDYHLLVEPQNFCLSTDPPVQYARPSIDVLFESAADAFGTMLIGVVLTGANSDGALGAVRIEKKGGLVLVQDPKTAESPVMPTSALEATDSPSILPIGQIAALLLKLTAARTSNTL